MRSLSRAFLAVYPPDDVLDALEERIAALRGSAAADGVRWLPRAQWHITMRFCGRVDDADALVGAVTAACAALPPVGGLRLLGAGGFPKARHASVLWIGVAGGDAATALVRIAAATEEACVAVGFEPDARVLRPHLTVARCSRARDLRPLVGELGEAPVGQAWTASEVRVMASDTRSSGAVHVEVARIPLPAAGSRT